MLYKNANASNYKEIKWRLFLQMEASSPSENLTYISYFSHTIVCKFHIELKRRKIHGAQDQLPSQSHLRHVLCHNTRIHISA